MKETTIKKKNVCRIAANGFGLGEVAEPEIK